MDIGYRLSQAILVPDGPMADFPGLPRGILFSMVSQPEFRGQFISLHKQDTVLFETVQDKMDVVVHQAETNDLNRMIRAQSYQAQSNSVDSGYELGGRAEEHIVF